MSHGVTREYNNKMEQNLKEELEALNVGYLERQQRRCCHLGQ
jgi:hypothetical protein